MPEIDDWLEENYEWFVREGRRTYQQIEAEATTGGDPALAAWARRRGAETASPRKRTAEAVNPNHKEA